MSSGRPDRNKALVLILLILVIVAGVVMLLSKHPWRSEPVEVVLTTPTPVLPQEVNIYVDGAVMSPGWYDLGESHSLEEAIRAAGGTTGDADHSKVKLYIYDSGETLDPQRINVNRADTWLLEALPGIGPALAQRIVDYRGANGAFERVEDLKRVTGIGEQTYEALKDLITAE